MATGPAVQTIDDVLARLAAVVAMRRAAGSTLGYFAAVYQRLVEQLHDRAASGGDSSASRLRALTMAAAQRYLAVFEKAGFEAPGAAAPSCWRFVWTASREDRLIVKQEVLLGFAAHLEMDLPAAAAAVCAAGAASDLAGLREDFQLLEELVAALLPRVDAAIGGLSPQLGLLQQLAGGEAAGGLHFQLDAVCADAWNHASVLTHLPPAARPAALAICDRQATLLGRLIAAPGGAAAQALEIIRLTETLDVRAVIDVLQGL